MPPLTPGSRPSLRRFRSFTLHALFVRLAISVAGLHLCTSQSVGLEVWVSFERAYEWSDIICVADAIEYVPAPMPTPEVPSTTACYRVRVTHVWKGEPPDTLELLAGHGRQYDPDGADLRWGIACGGPRKLDVGHRYLVFASTSSGQSLPAAHTHTRDLSAAHSDLITLQRTIGPGRRVVDDALELPAVSFRALARDTEYGDSLAQWRAVLALRELGDSSGFAVPALLRTLEVGRTSCLRRSICNALGRSSSEDRNARRAFFKVMEHAEVEVRLAAVEANCYPSFDELIDRILDRIKDPVPEVRSAALRRSCQLRCGRDMPTKVFIAALADTSPLVRATAAQGLWHATRDSSRVVTALKRCIEDPDYRVVAAALQTLERLTSRRP